MTTDEQMQMKEKWYSRPIFSVSNMRNSLHYYCELLGFEQAWTYKEKTQVRVAQVSKGDFELILTENLNRIGQARVFISLEKWEMEGLKKVIDLKQIPFEHDFWGYPMIKTSDPDGNELFFPVESEN